MYRAAIFALSLLGDSAETWRLPAHQAALPSVRVAARRGFRNIQNVDSTLERPIKSKDLEALRVSELRDLVKSLGEKPRNLRKVELVALCSALLKKQNEDKTTDVKIHSRPQRRTTHLSLPGTPLQKGIEDELLEPPVEYVEGKNNRQDFNFPIGALRDTRLNDLGLKNDMELTFLGTSSCEPGLTRGVSCVVLRNNASSWMFDCGEGSQIQMIKSVVKPTTITKVFLTHAHGDHVFGLPGMLCKMWDPEDENRGGSEPIDIYGPDGIRDLVRAAIQLSYTRGTPPYRLHELKNVPLLQRRNLPSPRIRTFADPRFNELPGSDIYPDKDGHYHLFDDGHFAVSAAPVRHTVPCVGFVITEGTKLGRLRPELAQPIVKRNEKALKDNGYRDPRKVLGELKRLKPGERYIFPDGTDVGAEDILDPERPGRKIVIMGDNSNGDLIAPLAKNADILVHEATNAALYEHDGSKAEVEAQTIAHGHSTPQMAGAFARRIGAKRLILTHFSKRYLGDASIKSMRTMWMIEHLARKTSNLWGRNDVIAAWDNMTMTVYKGV